MKGQWREFQITDIHFKAQIKDLNFDRRFSSANFTGSGRWGGGVELFLFLLQQSEGILRLGMCERLTS